MLSGAMGFASVKTTFHSISELRIKQILEYLDMSSVFEKEVNAINIGSKSDKIITLIHKVFATSSLLFLGYGLEDITFRMLFRDTVEFQNISITVFPKKWDQKNLEKRD